MMLLLSVCFRYSAQQSEHSAVLLLRKRTEKIERIDFMKAKTKKWIKAAVVRAIKTVAQTAIGSIGASAIISEVDWIVVVSASALAGVVSVLTSIAGLPEVKED